MSLRRSVSRIVRRSTFLLETKKSIRLVLALYVRTPSLLIYYSFRALYSFSLSYNPSPLSFFYFFPSIVVSLYLRLTLFAPSFLLLRSSLSSFYSFLSLATP